MVAVASEYNGIPVGPRLAYSFETQAGVPVDGTNPHARDQSPFVLRFVIPEALRTMRVLSTADVTSQAQNVNLIGNAALMGGAQIGSGASGSPVLNTSNINLMESFVSAGQFFTQQKSGFVSTLADAYTAADIALQVARLTQVPPLVLLVNPKELSITYNKTQSYQTRTRKGYVFEAFGEEQPTMSISGTTAGFVAGGNAPGAVSGYQWAARRDSAAWQNFVSLYHMYRNNGYIFDTVNRTEAHLFIGSIAIDYDQFTYEGHIESFSFSFDSAMPLRVEFQMEFHVSRMFDNDNGGAPVLPLRSAGGASTLNSSMGTALMTDTVPEQYPFDLFPG